MRNFDAKKYVGHWFTIASDKRNPWSRGGHTDCVTKEFQLTAEGNVDLYFRGKYPGGYRGINGTLYECDTGLCQATMGVSPHRIDF